MKKLLSLLSVLTISGTALPTTIAASSYQKEEEIIIREKREINNNLSCPIINNENPIYSKEDYFQVYYSAFEHNKIKTNLSLKTALGIEKMFYENRKWNFINYLLNLFKKMEQKK